MNDILLKLENETIMTDSGKASVKKINWEWRKGEHWVILGSNGSGKTRFLELLAEKAGKDSRTVSFENLERILEEQIRLDDSEFLGKVDTGTPLYRFLGMTEPDPSLLSFKTTEKYTSLLNQGIRTLSTGEMRKSLIFKAVLENPSLLMLDEPFDGLDVNSVREMRELITHLIEQGHPVLLILNRKSEILPVNSHIGIFDNHHLVFTGTKEAWEEYEKNHRETAEPGLSIPPPPADAPVWRGAPSLVKMKNVTVQYGEKVVLDNLSWEVRKGEHWKITGPNGAGKTTLLNLICGENQQAYCNDITLFGRRRGTGETVWEIKEKVGIISPALQLSYRVSASARMCIVSGLFDSIGVYDKVSPLQRALADRWLGYLGLEEKAERPLRRLSYGEQRLLLIARGLIKHPPLLILDEPCQGLDDHNRLKVLNLLGEFACQSESTLLYVTHHEEDRIQGIERHLQFVPTEKGFTLQEESVPPDR